MASIEKRGGRWYARYRDPQGVSRSRTFDRKVDAERFLVSVEHTKLTGSYVDPAAGRVTVKAYAERWRLAQVHRPSTAAQVETNLRRHVYPRFGDRPIGSLRPTELQGWVGELSDELAPATVALIYRYFASIYKAAVADRVIAASPCVGVEASEGAPRSVRRARG